GTTTSATFPGTAPYWVKIQRSGSTFTGSYSLDGTNWTAVSPPATIPMGTNVYIGLAVTSHADGVLCTGTFDNVANPGTGDWIDQDVGSVAVPGSGSFTGLTDEKVVNVMPNLGTLTLATNPTGLQVTLDGLPYTAPQAISGVVGMNRTVSAPSPQGGSTFV